MVRTQHQQRNQRQRRKCAIKTGDPFEPQMIWQSVVYELDHERMAKAKALGLLPGMLFKRSRESAGTFKRPIA